MKLYLEGIGLRGPGLNDWPSGRKVLAGRASFHPEEPAIPASPLLPPAERRRATDTVKLALAVCAEAMTHAGADATATPSVFSSSGGDGQTITTILETLAIDPGELSPTAFHNSVHNAPAGYWSIATQSRAASTSVCAYDWSFAAGLVEAAAQVAASRQRVVLVAYDLSYPEPLRAVRPIAHRFGVALVLAAERTPDSLAALSIAVQRTGAPVTSLPAGPLETLREHNPAARALPLLATLALEADDQVVLEYVANNVLALTVETLAGQVR